MPRQRLHLEGSGLAATASRILATALGVALVFYGAMLVLLAFKVDPQTVDSISGYRGAFDYLSGLEASEISGAARAVVAGAGLLLFLLVLALLWRGVPRPRLSRHSVLIATAPGGETEVQPRAFERVAEIAARDDPRVNAAGARFDGRGLVLDLELRDATTLVETLRAAQERTRKDLGRHGLDVERIDVRLTAYDRTKRRELA